MRLLELSANKDSFHTVHFNREGLTLVIGGRETASKDRTTNGVGKSLLIHLIHFCLGSSSKKHLADKLPDWTFTLLFESSGELHSASRGTLSQDSILLDGEERTVSDYRKWLTDQTFEIPQGIRALSFRALIPHFIRPNREAYARFDTASTTANDYGRLLRNGLLLGLDPVLIQEKRDLRQESEKMREYRANFEKDPIIKDILTGGMELELELSAAFEAVARLRKTLESYRVADDYHLREQELRETRAEVARIRNRRLIYSASLRQIRESLQTDIEVDFAEVESLYREAEAVLPERVTKTIKQVSEFHQRLLVERKRRLLAEQSNLQKLVQEIEGDIAKAHQRLDQQTEYLGTHGALDEFIALSKEMAEAVARRQRLSSYRDLLDEYDRRRSDLALGLQEQNVKTVKYLQQSRELVSSNRETFKELAQYIYPDRLAGIVVENNEGDNQLRFSIDVRIAADASDGINEAKIFCYDMTLLSGRHAHTVNFVFHDSRMFSDIDPRQRARVLEAASDMVSERGLQYIATLNVDQIEGMRSEFRDGFEAVIEEATTLVLSDATAEGKLLGIDIDLEYQL